MRNIHYLNKISPKGTELWTEDYAVTGDIADAEAVLVRSANMHDMVLPENLLAVARAGAGVNNIPLTSCADQGIVVFNTPGANANSVMELAICGMFLASRDIVGGINWVQANRENPEIARMVEKGKGQFAGNEIRGKMLGVVGLGAIGRIVANAACNGLGMNVIGHDPYISVDNAWALSHKVVHAANDAEVFAKADYLTVHVPLNDKTRGMINADVIAKMKPGAVLLNFSRNELVDNAAVKEAQIGRASCMERV